MPGLNFPVRADTTQFDQAMDRARNTTSTATAYIDRQFDDMAQQIQRSSADAGNAIGLIISGSIIAAAAGLTTHLGKVLNALSDIGDRAQDLRLPVNLLQALSVAADQARVPAEKLNSALDQFTRVSKQDSDTGEKFYTALGNIGQQFVEAFKTAPTQTARLNILSDALHSTTDEVKKAQLGLTAFGTDNERVLSLFDKGATGLNSYIEQVRRLGLTVDESLVQKAQEARSQLALLSRVLSDDLSSSIGKVIPYLVQMLPYLERVGNVIVATLGAVSSAIADDQNKTNEVLRSEINTLQGEISKAESARDRLANAAPTTSDKVRTFLRKELGIDDDSLQDIDAQIAKLKAEIDKKEALLLESQRRGALKPPAPSDPGAAFKPRPSLDDDDKDAFDHAANSVKRHMANLQADTAAVGMNAAAHEGLRVEMRLLEAAGRDDDEITIEKIARYAELRQSMSAEQALQMSGIDLGKTQTATFLQLSLAMRGVAGSFDNTKRAFQGVNDAVRFAGNELIEVIDRATQKGANFGQIMSDVFRNIAKQALQAAITGEGAFAKLFGTASTTGGVGGISGLIAATFGAGGNPTVPGAPGLVGIAGNTPVPTFMADGGRADAGQLIYAGEHGPNPKLFRAPEPMIITPGDVRPASGGGGVALHMPVSIDARGAQAGVAEQIAAAMQQVPGMVARTVGDMRRYDHRALR